MKMKSILGAASVALALGATSTTPSMAQGDQFIGQIQVYGFNFCPYQYTPANGQLLAISQYTALFSLYGTQFGGDGRTTFGMPNLQNRVAVGRGRGAGLTPRTVGEQWGAPDRTLSVAQMPSHNHSLGATSNGPASADPTGRVLVTFAGVPAYAAAGSNNVTMNGNTIAPNGGSQPISVQDPVLGMTICIALTGIFPSRG